MGVGVTTQSDSGSVGARPIGGACALLPSSEDPIDLAFADGLESLDGPETAQEAHGDAFSQLKAG
jgi:hypothetical protein